MALPESVRVIIGENANDTRVLDLDTQAVVPNVIGVDVHARVGQLDFVVAVSAGHRSIVEGKPKYDMDMDELTRVAKDMGFHLLVRQPEHTSVEVAALAGKLIHHSDPEVRALAASALTQAPDR